MFKSHLSESLGNRLLKLGVPVGVNFWDGSSVTPAVPPRVRLSVRTPRALAALVNPSMGKLARHYVEQDLDVEGDAREVVRLSEALSKAPTVAASVASRFLRRRRHSREFDREAVRSHYDVSDDFYRLWLDARRVYSCAYFRRADDTLETAQEQKLDLICRKLMLAPGERLLDIGCGWGGLVIHAARRYGVQALGITLSRNQLDLARERVAREGLGDRCSIELLDYRDVPESRKFDKIASVGMFEHVGLNKLPVYFGKIARLLADDGLVMNHGITTMDPKSRAVGMGAGQFIHRYIFPHGELPHLSLAVRAMSEQNLEAIDIESLRFHYAKTLQAWAARLEAAQSDARRLVGEQRYRTWLVYLAGCAHAFAHGWISIHQILAAKADRRGMAPVSWTRSHVYAP